MDKARRQSFHINGVIWCTGFILMPAVMLVDILSHPGETLAWKDVLSAWLFLVPFLVLYATHDLVSFPLLKKKSYVAYAVFLALLLAAWAVWCFVFGTRPPIGLPSPPGVPPGPNPDPVRGPLRPEVFKFVLGILVVVANLGVRSYVSMKIKEKENAALEREVMRRQLESLRFQLNPHFFMNTMNNIEALILTDPEKAVSSVEHLSSMMRLTIYQKDAILIPLADEIGFIGHYIALMKLRYDEFTTIETSFPDECGDAMIPPLTISTLLENAFKHGVAPGKPSFVKIAVTLDGSRIACRCSNSLHPEVESRGHGIGSDNIRQRLALIYRQDFSLDVNESDSGYEVLLDIPSTASIDL